MSLMIIITFLLTMIAIKVVGLFPIALGLALLFAWWVFESIEVQK